MKGAVLGELETSRGAAKRKARQDLRASGFDVSIQKGCGSRVESAHGTQAADGQSLHRHDESGNVARGIAGVKSVPIDGQGAVSDQKHMVGTVASMTSGVSYLL